MCVAPAARCRSMDGASSGRRTFAPATWFACRNPARNFHFASSPAQDHRRSKPPAAQTVSPLPLEEVPEVQVAPQAASPLPVGEGPGVSVSRIVPPSADNFLADSPHLPRLPAKDRQWAIWAVGGLAVGILALIAIRFTLSPSTVIVNVGQPVAAAPLAASPVINSSSGKADREVAKGGHVSAPKKEEESVVTDKSKEPGEEDKPEGDLRARLEEAVFLIQVEKSGRFWPFATCVAVGGDTLLTTAREAVQLAKWRAEKTFEKIWVTRPVGNFKEEAQDIRVIAPFASLPEESGDLFYVDIGLLTVRGPLPKGAPWPRPRNWTKSRKGFLWLASASLTKAAK